MAFRSNLAFHTELADADEFISKMIEVGFTGWEKKAVDGGLISFNFKDLSLDDIKIIMTVAGHLNAKKAIGL